MRDTASNSGEVTGRNKFAWVLSLSLGLMAAGVVLAGEEKVPLDKLPKAVNEAVEKRFPKVERKGASEEKDGDKVAFEVWLNKDGKTIAVAVTEAGAVTPIKQELASEDLPKEVAKTFAEKYPKAKYEVVETVTKVADGKETLGYYGAVLVAADKQKWEVEVLPDGKFKSATEVKVEKK